MITLKSDELTFSFPEIGETLRRLIEKHIRTTLPRLLAENRAGALPALEKLYEFREAGAETRNAAVEKVLKATPAQIEAALRRKCIRRARLDRSGAFAKVRIEFQRTLRIPDDGKVYPLPAGMGAFPLRHVDDFSQSVPDSWLKRGGVMMPMHQSEALWLSFSAGYRGYPFAVKIGAGKINAVTGEAWSAGLQEEPQNYLVLPEQPWLDGFAAGKGFIRQFVAMPLGDGYSVEEQLTGKANVGGIQIQIFPMKAEAYFREELADALPSTLEDLLREIVRSEIFYNGALLAKPEAPWAASDMGLGAGGKMRQEIYDDPHDFADWETGITSRCFVHLCNSQVWRQITGSNPPHPPLTAREYAKSGIPWFDYYRDDLRAVGGSKILDGVKSVAELGKTKGASPLPDNPTIAPELIVQYGNTRRPDEVREWSEP